jgi:hypothetical protein
MSTTYPCDICGSESATSDYCDMCGAAIADPAAADPAAAAPPAAGAPPADPTGVSPSVTKAAPDGSPVDAQPGPPGDTCYFCGAPRESADVFCEVCGLDFVSGRMPARPDPTPVPASGIPMTTGALGTAGPTGWTAIVGADRAFFDSNVTAGVVAFPDAVAPREIPLAGDQISIGRRSEPKGYFPDIDLSSPVDDPAVSRRHAALERQPDGSWAVLDSSSTNGTWINDEDEPLARGVLRALHDGDRLLLGAFSCITIRNDPLNPTTVTPGP